ncbi:hypothetical protein [uncultured Fusobacterium sp.]|uniref:hypothetical protein n=1 Tax=uncultured Fusobacterium sp. TaxID=159267 RepID=UPI0025F8283B|nr:hypothetical protein [uncultured Fusobacterium sp.]
MAVNYYDQFQPLTYNPMTLQEMLIGPQMMQQKHDQYQALLDQEGLFDVPALEVDKPGVQQWMDKYKENINDLSDQLLRSGYNKDLSRRARQILQEKQQAISSRGYLGRASQAYQQYLKNVEDEKKRLEKGEINRDQYERGLTFALQRYNQSGGAGSNATYSPWYSTRAVDLQELVSKYGKEITPQTIAKDLGYKYDPSTGIITDSSNKTVTLSPERIKNTIISRIMSNPEAMSYLKERQQLGLTNNIMEDLDKLGNEGALTFYRNDVENKTNYDFGLFKKYQQGLFNDAEISKDAIAEIISLDNMPIENLAHVAKYGLGRGNTYRPGSYMPGALSSYGTEFQTNNTKESEMIKSHANEQLDKDFDYWQQIDPSVTRDDIIEWEDKWAKNNKATLAFNFVPSAKYEEKYSQDIDKIKNGSFPNSIKDWAIEGQRLEDGDDWIDAIEYDPKDNKVVAVSTGWSGNGYMLAEITMQNGKTIKAVRKPQESDKAKFAIADSIFNHYYDNNRGISKFVNPETGAPIIMNKFITPDGLKATVTLQKPVYNNKGQLMGYENDPSYTNISYNDIMQRLTPFVLKDKYVNKYSKPRESY